MSTLDKRVELANKVLADLSSHGTIIERRHGGWWVCWQGSIRGRKQTVERRYQTLRGGHHPVWHRLWPHGGTACEALYHLIRWCRGQTVAPLSVWTYWASPQIGLLTPATVCYMAEHGWPQSVHCVRCGRLTERMADWRDLARVEGPLCTFGKSCKTENGRNQEAGL